MREQHKLTFLLAIFSLVLCFSPGCLEQEIVLGREQDRSWEGFELDGIIAVQGRWNSQDLLLKPDEYAPDDRTEFLLHFNEGPPFHDDSGRYSVQQVEGLRSTTAARLGVGAAAFTSDRQRIILVPVQNPVEWQDFSLEFWLYPANLLDGEIVLTWIGKKIDSGASEGGAPDSTSAGRTSADRTSAGHLLPQSFSCTVMDRRLKWEFDSFFGNLHIELEGLSPLLPRSWHHHIIRYDNTSGLFEYLVDGTPEDVVYVTDTGREGGSVVPPDILERGKIILGDRFTGLLDELRMSSAFIREPRLTSYSDTSGTGTSGIIDTRHPGSRVISIQAVYTTPGNSAITFAYRTFDTWAGFGEPGETWLPFVPGAEMSADTRGRYLQVRVELFPDGSRMQSPSLSEVRITYEPNLPPSPIP